MDVVRNIPQGAGLPVEADVKSTNRIGDTQRARAVLHIGEMRAAGYLRDEDAQVRLNFIGDAQTAAQLVAILADLPGYPEDTPGLLDGFDWKNPHWYVPVLGGGAAVGAAVAVTPGVVLASMKLLNTPLGVAVFVPTLIIGIALFLGCFVSMCYKLSN